jgi:hypothetical protein
MYRVVVQNDVDYSPEAAYGSLRVKLCCHIDMYPSGYVQCDVGLLASSIRLFESKLCCHILTYPNWLCSSCGLFASSVWLRVPGGRPLVRLCLRAHADSAAIPTTMIWVVSRCRTTGLLHARIPARDITLSGGAARRPGACLAAFPQPALCCVASGLRAWFRQAARDFSLICLLCSAERLDCITIDFGSQRSTAMVSGSSVVRTTGLLLRPRASCARYLLSEWRNSTYRCVPLSPVCDAAW